MIEIKSELVLTALAGDDIGDFIKEAKEHIQKHYIKRCLLSFNGWYYILDTKYNIPYEEIINDYCKYINRGSE